MEFGLYVHIPFCAARCPYCDFTVSVTRKRPEREYAAALRAELRARAREDPWAAERVRSVYFGGGTPSLVDPAVIAGVLDEARRVFGERFAPREITLEANPEGLDAARLSAWRRCGVDRLSLGAQSFHPGHLAFLGRAHRAADIREAMARARRAGFTNVSLDLIFGMPGQTPEALAEDLEEALALDPEHLSCYNLTLEPGTAHTRAFATGRFELPGEDAQARMFELIGARLAAGGLRRYEISNFARPGFESVHNRHYWLRESYLGLGTGAHSFLASPRGGARWWNVRDHRRYIALALEGKSCEEGTEALGPADARREWVFLRLRGAEGFSRREFGRLFGIALERAFPGVIPPLEEAGLIKSGSDRLALTERGMLLSDEVFLAFF
jgi:oxygen-independent coproporphyrinogen-3 oxidase